MSLKENDIHAIARERRSSNASTSQHTRQPSNKSAPADALPQGVTNMLRTTTDFGDLDTAALKPPRLRPGGPHRRPSAQHGPALSRTSSHYSQYSRAESLRSRASNHSAREPSIPGAWPTPGIQQPTFDTRSLVTSASNRGDPGQRSYSLTASHHPSRLLGKNNRSATSLQSVGPTVNRPRSPYQHPGRFRRPSNRPGSPAWSDTHTPTHNRPNFSRPMPGPHTQTAYPFPPQSQQSQLPWPLTPQGHHAQSHHQFQRSALPMHPSLEGRRQQGPSYARSGAPFRTVPSPLRNDQGFSRFSKRANDAPYIGFVQRVKNLLEERASTEEPARVASSNATQEDFVTPAKISDDFPVNMPGEYPVEEPQTPAELPASSPNVRRLTRDMVKAAIGSPSDGEHMSTPNLLDSTILVPHELEPDSSSLLAAESDGETAASSTESYPLAQHEDIAAETTDKTRENEDMLDLEDDDLSDMQDVPDMPISANVSEASHSSQDLMTARPAELATERTPHASPSFSDDPDRVKSMDRPVSLPPTTEVKPEPSIMAVRQSMPAPIAGLVSRKHVQESSELGQQANSIDDMIEETLPSQGAPPPKALEIHTRPASAADARSSWATSIASRVLSEPETTDPHSSWAMPINSPDRTPAVSRPASAGDLPLSWTRSSVAIRKSTLPTLPESKHSSMTLVDEEARDGIVEATSARRSGARDSMMAPIPIASEGSAPAPIQPENRFSAIKQFQSGLPDLTEDSQEDASTTNLRMLGTRPPPFRNSRQRGEGRASHRASATAPQAGPSSYLSRKISNIKGIPSLQFSSTDLAGSLNAALGLRSSRSLESFQAAEALKKRPRPRGIVMASPTKTDSNRDRYKSYFLNDIISAAEAEEGVPKQEDTEKSLQEQEELIQEIEKISIPSITHLSMRLSELFPAIKGSRSEPDIAKTVADIRSTIEEIRELGSVDSIENGKAKRSSVGSMVRPSHEAGNVGEKRKSSTTKSILDKELPPLPREAHTTPRPSIASGPLPSIPGSADETVELEGNHPALIVKAQAAHRKGSVPSLKKSRSKAILKHIIPGTPDARPWNNADNFPWTSKTPAVHLKEPGTEDDGDDEGSSDTTTRLRSKKSEPSTTLSDAQGVRIARTMSPGPRMDASLIPRVSRPSVEESEEQAPLKKGIIGSISRKMSKKPRKDSAGFPLDPEFLHPHERLSATPAGDRYPSTSLTPPVGLHIDETARSFFSDDSSENEEPRIGSLRKRLTRLKGKKSHSRALSAGDATPSTQRLMSSPPHDDSILHGSHPDVSDADVVLMMYDEPAIGMSKAEFRAKRLVEKIRRLWFRSGKLIRNISHSKQHQYHDQTHMYEGSAYEHI